MTLVSELFHWKQSKARGMSFVTELCSLEKRQSQGRLFTRKLKETPGSLAGQNSEEFKHQVESDFAPEPSSQGLFWKLSEREFISLLCGTNDATSPWYLQRRHLVMFMCKGQAVSRGMYGRRLKCDLGSRGVACVSSASNERCPALSLWKSHQGSDQTTHQALVLSAGPGLFPSSLLAFWPSVFPHHMKRPISFPWNQFNSSEDAFLLKKE